MKPPTLKEKRGNLPDYLFANIIGYNSYFSFFAPMETLLETLQQYGLSEKEAKVYLTALSLGSAPASSIARNSHENRATVYTLIKELIKKGYMTELKRNSINYFSAVSPDVLNAQLETKYISFQQKLPELMALAEKIGNKPKVQFFEGVE